MAWAWVYLAVSVAGALLVLNAFRPLRHQFLVVPSFFAGWYTGEMPVWHVVWQVAVTAVFAATGAFRWWPAWVGLGVNLAAWAGLLVHFRISGHAHHVFARAEEGMRSVARFGPPERWRYEWDRPYSRDEWLDQLPTFGGHAQLPPGQLREPSDSIGAAIGELGGGFTMHYTTVAVVAVRGRD